jgi:tetratricopeptide (TPR) repeat protein
MNRTMSKLFTLLLLFIVATMLHAQDMNPEAGKLFNEGNKFLKEGNFQKAIENYDKAAKIEKDARIYYQKGLALKNSGKLKESKDAYYEAVKIDPKFEVGYNALGTAYFNEGDFAKAAENFEKVVEVTKNNQTRNKVKKNLSLAYTKLGEAALNGGNSNKAIEHLNKAVDNNKYDAAYLLLAKLYTDLGRYDDAITAAQGALNNRSGVAKGGPYYYMGLAYKNKGDNEKAKEMFNQAKSDATYRKTAEYELSLLK